MSAPLKVTEISSHVLDMVDQVNMDLTRAAAICDVVAVAALFDHGELCDSSIFHASKAAQVMVERAKGSMANIYNTLRTGVSQ